LRRSTRISPTWAAAIAIVSIVGCGDDEFVLDAGSVDAVVVGERIHLRPSVTTQFS
jgi:hypothetical protein